MLAIEMLPAIQGDALLVQYGDPDRPRCLLIDGGPPSRRTRQRIRELLPGDPTRLELVVVTHIDSDHIAGILHLLEDDAVELEPADVWFNAWKHLPTDVLGAKQGEALSAAIVERGLPWNAAFGGEAVVASGDGPLPAVELADGMTLTLLSPTPAKLAELRPVWKKEVEKAGLVPGHGAQPPPVQPDRLGDRPLDPEALAAEPYEPDDSEANGSSIAFLAEHDGKRLLLTGDAHPEVLVEGLRRLEEERGVDRIAVDAVKASHHGGKHNTSAELIDRVDCGRWLFSTSGQIHHHPDPESVARVVVRKNGDELVFNHRSPESLRWDSSRLRRKYGYRGVWPAEDQAGTRVDV